MRPENAKKNIIGYLIALGAICTFGVLSTAWWQTYNAPKERLILCFRQSVNGIDIGTPVKVMGVPVGQIEVIDIEKPDALNGEYCPTVHIVLDGERLENIGMPRELASPDILEKEIARGLRGKLTLISPMQGNYFVDLVYAPKTKAVFSNKRSPNIPEIPAVQNELQSTVGETARALQKLSQTDFLKLERKINDSLDELKKTLTPENLKKLSDAAAARLSQTQALLADPEIEAEIKNINRQLETVREQIRKGQSDFLENVHEKNGALRSLGNSVLRVEKQAREMEKLFNLQSPDTRRMRKNLHDLLSAIEEIVSTLHPLLQLATGVSSGSEPVLPE